MAQEHSEDNHASNNPDLTQSPELVSRLRKILTWVVILNFAYFIIENIVALAIGSVSLFADSVDFLEDTAINLLVIVALGWSLQRQSKVGRVLAAIILIPAIAALVTAVMKFSHPTPPDFTPLLITAVGAIIINSICTYLLASYRDEGGSMIRGAFLAARNDIIANVLIIVVAFLTTWTKSGWPDIILGLILAAINISAAKEVWELADEEDIAARALAGEDLDDD